MDDFKDIFKGVTVMWAGPDRVARVAFVTEIFPGGRLNLTILPNDPGDSMAWGTPFKFASCSHGLPEKVDGKYLGPPSSWHRRISSHVAGGGE